ncbi:S41 family peptidase [Pleionea sp. CnH1-48]|uniref:S41 family peptidase n=1 Tax=Pleionea sp. CnH1-48 TaxID=2954494 RepID=UPI00209688FA|nr:S41 family peptidase [Pleionea sp. CnH1-48]MCO7225177.1 S41 family peptidase [Pleionea sp. CnH1-48]
MVRSRLLTLLLLGCVYSGFLFASGKTEKEQIPLKELRAFAETYWQIKQSYVDEIDDRTLIEGAISGMLQSLDPYSNYLDKNALMDLQSSSDGFYDGLGVEVVNENQQVKIVNTLNDSPAQRAGIMVNDVITEVNHAKVKLVGADRAIEQMRGKAGESIHLRISRAGKPIDFTLVREKLEVKSVALDEVRPGYWHARISVFQRDTGYELSRQLRLNAIRPGFKGLVLDLRDNPGGVLKAAVDVVDLMLEQGLIVVTDGRDPDSKQRFYANPGDELESIPLVVLINKNSASASEIVAGALQDHGRAIIAGSESYGKGVVQSVLPIRHDAAIKLTTSRYFTPKGRSIHGKGILPDVAMAEQSEADHDSILNEALELLVKHSQRNL